jgi:hypothetical protein
MLNAYLYNNNTWRFPWQHYLPRFIGYDLSLAAPLCENEAKLAQKVGKKNKNRFLFGVLLRDPVFFGVLFSFPVIFFVGVVSKWKLWWVCSFSWVSLHVALRRAVSKSVQVPIFYFDAGFSSPHIEERLCFLRSIWIAISETHFLFLFRRDLLSFRGRRSVLFLKTPCWHVVHQDRCYEWL